MTYTISRGLFNAKAITEEEQQWYNLTHVWVDDKPHNFPEGISLKVIVRLEFEHAYYEYVVLQFSHYATGTIT